MTEKVIGPFTQTHARELLEAITASLKATRGNRGRDNFGGLQYTADDGTKILFMLQDDFRGDVT